MNWSSAMIRVPDKPLLTIGEVAMAVGYNAKTVKRWVRDGTFPAGIRVGDGVRWSSLAVGVWLAWQEFKPQPLRQPQNDEETDDSPKGVKAK